MEIGGEHIQEASLEITVTRADGTVEQYGVVDSYTRRPRWRTILSWLFDRQHHTH